MPIPEPPETSGVSLRADNRLSPAASPVPAGDRIAGAALPAHSGNTGQTATPAETGDIRFPGISDERWQTVGNLLVRALIRHRAATGGNRPAVSSRGFTPVPAARRAAAGFVRTGYTPEAKQPKPVTRNGLPVNPDNPLCEPSAVRTVDWEGKRIRKQRYITSEITRNINALLTFDNACHAIGINHEQVSQWEGGGKLFANVPWSPHHKGNHSGVTVASGLDLGQRKLPAELRQIGLPEKLIEKLAPYLGHQKETAVAFLQAHPLSLTNEEIDLINHAIMHDMSKKAIAQWNGLVKRNRKGYPNAPYFHELTSDQQTLLFSRFYHTGSFLRQTELLSAVFRNDWNEAINLLTKQAQRFLQHPSTEWKGNRLNNEVKWYKKGSQKYPPY